ncbi:hypothetical protein EYF80_040417 [Liparis tanakae]|uniref:Uncharacterized protein n=1 Tax=Liparis tanakae TaxID=230148 RepID=A0A4Z2G725_9TELE|nr:hypothetical protein EYF80_040417 [Liparis tanakae]
MSSPGSEADSHGERAKTRREKKSAGRAAAMAWSCGGRHEARVTCVPYVRPRDKMTSYMYIFVISGNYK